MLEEDKKAQKRLEQEREGKPPGESPSAEDLEAIEKALLEMDGG